MKRPEVRALTIAILERLVHDKGLSLPEVNDRTEILTGGVGIDSLDLATIVVELGEATGRDPFADGFVEFTTLGELVSLYSE